MDHPRIGWIGLGHMGIPMATNLQKAGYPLTLYNRTRTKAEAFGVPVAKSPALLAQQVDIVITMLSDDASQEEVLFGENGVAKGLRSGQTVINMGTISPEASRSTAQRLAELGVETLDAPVSGSVKPAAEGTLVILVGGMEVTYRRCLPVFDVLGKRSFLFGGHGQGACAKLATNMILGLTLQALAEAVVLSDKCGLDRATLLDMIAETAVASPIVNLKLPVIRSNNYAAAFPLRHMAKDFRLALAESATNGATLPLTAAATDSFAQAVHHGFGDLDIMAILKELRT